MLLLNVKCVQTKLINIDRVKAMKLSTPSLQFHCISVVYVGYRAKKGRG